jgi:hypothetical protein
MHSYWPHHTKFSMLLPGSSRRGLLVHVDQGRNWFDKPTHRWQLLWRKLHVMEQEVSDRAALHQHVVQAHYWLAGLVRFVAEFPCYNVAIETYI